MIGAGGITRALLELLQPFNCNVTVIRRRPDMVLGATRTLGLGALHEVLTTADVVVVACPLTSQTLRLLDQDAFNQMKRCPLIINVGRGAVVDHEALWKSLVEGHIFGAALDVTDPEPLPPNNPLWGLSNVVITPHIANDKALSEGAYVALVGDNVQRFVIGESLVNIVPAEDLAGPAVYARSQDNNV